MTRTRSLAVPALAAIVALVALPALAELDPAPGAQQLTEATLGAAELVIERDGGLEALPLLETMITVAVHGPLVTTRYEQSYENPYDGAIEARYLFPLGEGAAIDTMELRIGTRVIVAHVREKAEAVREYQAARDAGQKAALVEARRRDLVRIAVANVGPRERVDVVVTTIAEIALAEGRYQLAIPLTYTPRYQRAAPVDPRERDAVENGIEPPLAQRFADARQPSVPRARITVRLAGGAAIDGIMSPSHEVGVRFEGDVTVVQPRDELLLADRDFRLEWRPLFARDFAGTVWHGVHDGTRYALVHVVPPDLALAPHAALPSATVFVLDRSGSMDGPSIRTARAALETAVRGLRDDDLFTVVAFDDAIEAFGDRLEPAEAATRESACSWIRGIDARGGTEIAPALAAGLSLAKTSPPSHVARVIVLTDGAVAAERALLLDLAATRENVRVHVVGIGQAPQRGLVRRLAATGRGLSAFVAEGNEGAREMERFLERIARPVLASPVLTGGSLPSGAAAPTAFADLHAGEPMMRPLRLDASAGDADPALDDAALVGDVHGASIRIPLRAVAVEDPEVARLIAKRWAQREVESLQDAQDGDGATTRARVVDLALAHGLVTPYTSLVAVEEIRTVSGSLRTIDVPNGAPVGTLPFTATSWPLWRRIGWMLLVLGALGILKMRLGSRP